MVPHRTKNFPGKQSFSVSFPTTTTTTTRTMVTMTKKQLRQADDEWVVVGLKESKSVEKGWVIVADKTKKSAAPVEEPERVDKILASHGYCKRSEAKSWVRHGRITFEGETVKKPDQKVVVRLYDGVMVDGKPIPVRKEKENDDGEAALAALEFAF